MKHILLILALSIQPILAATQTAATCSRADVAAALALCSDGDTLAIPAGTCTWTTVLNITKAITMQGAGVGETIIQDGVTSGALMNWTLVRNGASRMTGIEFSNNGRLALEANGIIIFTGSDTNGSTLRVDHCKFDHLNGIATSYLTVIGVVDHNTFLYVPTARAANVYCPAWGGTAYASGAWSAATQFGTDRFLFFEDNLFAYDSTAYAHIDSWYGGRWVARYNTFTNGWIESHGTDSAGRLRGCRAMEVYNNTFRGNDTTAFILNFRSGVSLVHDNVATGFTASPRFELANYRSSMWFTPFGGANGVNTWDKNLAGGPFGSSPYTATSGSGLTVTVSGAGWMADQWKGYSIKRASGKSVSSLTRSGSTATAVTSSAHGFSSGNVVTISGASPDAYNLSAIITVVDSTTFTYGLNFGSTPTTPATGTIFAVLGNDFSEVLGNTATVVTFLATGFGSQYDLRFTTGDTFSFWKVSQALDQCGVSGGSLIVGDDPVMPGGWNDQTVDPCYEWNNTEDGGNVDFLPGHACIVAGTHFFNDTAKPGYVPYSYPHPLTGADSTPPTLASSVISTAGTTITLTFSEPVTRNAGNPTLSLSGGACSPTYSSGSGTGSHVYTLSRTVYFYETGTLSANPGTDNWEDPSGNDFTSVSGATISNGSLARPNLSLSSTRGALLK